jgi:hypothetical protein
MNPVRTTVFLPPSIQADVTGLDRILGEDLLLIDVMSGSELTKPELLEVLGWSQFKFEAIERVESRLRLYGETAVLNGLTQMSGRCDETPFAVRGRYTHFYVRAQSQWRLVSAQGTGITDGQTPSSCQSFRKRA